MINKKTLVIGGSENPTRYSNKAIKMLREYGYDVLSIAKRKGKVDDVKIDSEFPENDIIDTVTMYIGPQHQPEYYQKIIGLKPKRVIFNPGTENPEFSTMLKEQEIESTQACTLVLLRTNQY